MGDKERAAACQSTPRQTASHLKNLIKSTVTELAAPRHAAPDLDIYEHPYVKRLEERVEKLEAKYEGQVRRTEEIQLKGQEKLLELQRMIAVGQSQTLADFMLKAKDWMLGAGSDTENREATDANNP